MVNSHEKIKKFSIHILSAIPFLIASWFMASSALKGNAALLNAPASVLCLLIGGFILGPPIARLISQPVGGLFHPDNATGIPPPQYSMAKAKRSKGLFEEAFDEYRKISDQYPEEIKPYLEMIDIAILHLKDRKRAERIYEKALVNLKDKPNIEMIKRSYEEIIL